MTHYQKPRRPAGSPEVCARCTRRQGVVSLALADRKPAGQGSRESRTVWLCEQCLERLKRDAASN